MCGPRRCTGCDRGKTWAPMALSSCVVCQDSLERRHGSIPLCDDLAAELHEPLKASGLELLIHWAVHGEGFRLFVRSRVHHHIATHSDVDGWLECEARLDESVAHFIFWLAETRP